MKFFLLFGALVALSQSLSPGEKNIEFTENGFVITDANGKKITINKPMGPFGPKSVGVSISGPMIPTKKISFDDKLQKEVSINGVNVMDLNNDYADEQARSKRSKSEKTKTSKSEYNKSTQETDVLSEILKSFEGVNDEASYEKLLSRVNKAVKNGELNESIYDILKQVAQQKYGQNEIAQQVQTPYYGQQYQYQPYPYRSVNMYQNFPYYQQFRGYNGYPAQYQGYEPQSFYPGFWRSNQFQPQPYEGYQQYQYQPFYQGYRQFAY